MKETLNKFKPFNPSYSDYNEVSFYPTNRVDLNKATRDDFVNPKMRVDWDTQFEYGYSPEEFGDLDFGGLNVNEFLLEGLTKESAEDIWDNLRDKEWVSKDDGFRYMSNVDWCNSEGTTYNIKIFPLAFIDEGYVAYGLMCELIVVKADSRSWSIDTTNPMNKSVKYFYPDNELAGKLFGVKDVGAHKDKVFVDTLEVLIASDSNFFPSPESAEIKWEEEFDFEATQL